MPSNMCQNPARQIELHPVKTLPQAQLYAKTRTSSNMHPLPEGKALLTRLRRGSFLVYSGTEVLLGTASLHETQPGIGEVGIFLTLTHRNCGWAPLILAELEAHAKQAGFFALRADIFEDNTRALELFKKHGYRPFQLLEKAL